MCVAIEHKDIVEGGQGLCKILNGCLGGFCSLERSEIQAIDQIHSSVNVKSSHKRVSIFDGILFPSTTSVPTISRPDQLSDPLDPCDCLL